jgi:hypothetical protein
MDSELTKDDAVTEVARLIELIQKYNSGDRDALGDMAYRDALKRLMYLRRKKPHLK